MKGLIEAMGIWKAWSLWCVMSLLMPTLLMGNALYNGSICGILFGGFLYVGMVLWFILIKLCEL